MHEILIYFALKYEGNWDRIYQALENKEKVSLDEIRKTEKTVKNSGWKTMTILDYDYAEQLKKAYKPPFVLWFKGDRKILRNNLVTITGNRLDQVARERLNNVVTKILDQHTLVVTNFKKVDQEVVKCAKGRPVVCVLAGGFNTHPGATKLLASSSNLVVSEYPPATPVKTEHLAQCNRITAALGGSLVLVNSEKNHGVNSLVTNFLNLGKEIYCFPGDGNSNDGNSHLIKQGAHLITQPEDLVSQQQKQLEEPERGW